MNPETRQTLHLGVNFVFSPPIVLGTQKYLEFEGALAERGLEFGKTQRSKEKLQLSQTGARPLQVTVAQAGPQVSQFLVTAPNPARTQEEFLREAEDATDGFFQVWNGRYQVVQRDCTIRHLYDVPGEHSFRYLWEHRLGQQEEDLELLGRPVLGGGLRLVMPSAGPQGGPTVEVKIESYLRDSSKIFVETQFTWREPSQMADRFTPRETVEEVAEFSTGPLLEFITTGGA